MKYGVIFTPQQEQKQAADELRGAVTTPGGIAALVAGAGRTESDCNYSNVAAEVWRVAWTQVSVWRPASNGHRALTESSVGRFEEEQRCYVENPQSADAPTFSTCYRAGDGDVCSVEPFGLSAAGCGKSCRWRGGDTHRPIGDNGVRRRLYVRPTTHKTTNNNTTLMGTGLGEKTTDVSEKSEINE